MSAQAMGRLPVFKTKSDTKFKCSAKSALFELLSTFAAQRGQAPQQPHLVATDM
jgi:hypothetical protein